MVTATSSSMRYNFGSRMWSRGDADAKSESSTGNAPRSEHATPSQVKRTRKTHSKVRTGCLTCKIRRKKCDETKPACVRCTSTGRKCDGYTSPISAPASTINSPITQKFDAGVASFPSTAEAIVLEPLPARANGISPYRGLVEVDSSPVANDISPSKSFRSWPRQGTNCTEGLGSIKLLDNDYTAPDHELDKFANEELEDFILSYVSPIQGVTTIPSDNALTFNESASSPKLSPFAVNIDSCHPVSPIGPFDKFSIPTLPCAYSGLTEVERHCFTYFRYHTGPSFSSYFESSIWRAYAVSAALAHPVVLTCAAACGAAHRRFGYGISPEAFALCAHADRLHKKALSGLLALKQAAKEKPGSTGVYDRDAIMTGELLLGLFQGFQGNYQTIVEHINNGMKHLLARPLTLVHSESRCCTTERQPHVFRQLLHRLRRRALELFKSPVKILVMWGQGRQLPSIPAAFIDLEEARDFMFTEVEWIMHAPARVWRDTKQRTEVQDLHVRRLLSWSVAYAKTVQKMDRSSQEKKACTLLKLVRSTAYMLLYLTFFVDAEAEDDPAAQESGLAYISRKLWQAVEQREELNTKLETVKILVEGILDEDGIFNYDEHSVSFDSAISPTGHPSTTEQVVPERSGKTKHLVKRFMQKNPNNKALWEMLGVYGVAGCLWSG